MFFHWNIICSLLNIVTGTSLIFIAYIICVIIWLDKGIDVVLDKEGSVSYPQYSYPKNAPQGFNKTIVLGVFLIILGIAAIFFSNKYRKQYTFECTTFLVDKQSGIYHLDYDNECEIAANAHDLVMQKGYQMDESYTFCEWCKEWIEDMESEYAASKYIRR